KCIKQWEKFRKEHPNWKPPETDWMD
ncbi:hypothetical protein LCGC14_2554970, partial [marine sediment metagenome]